MWKGYNDHINWFLAVKMLAGTIIVASGVLLVWWMIGWIATAFRGMFL